MNTAFKVLRFVLECIGLALWLYAVVIYAGVVLITRAVIKWLK